jgi:outer membrane protein W
MKTSLARALAVTVVLSSPAFAQARPATTQPATSAQAAPTGQFESGPFYAGPRVWIGNLNGAIAFGGQIERGFTKAGQYGPGIIAGGAGIDYYSWSNDFAFGDYKYSVIPLQIFSNYHFVIESNKKLDPYAGIALVYSLVNASWEGSGVAASADGNYMDFAGQAGLRYFLTDKVALQGQIGFGYGTLGLGATWKF